MIVSLNIETALSLKGISYIIYTTEGEFIRQNQPCYGELRKYEKDMRGKPTIHTGECTQPVNPKPGDLHHPFPDGTPLALVIPFPRYAKSKNTDVVLETMFSKDSPWYSGFKEVTFFKNPEGFLAGIILNDMDFDPTVLVNCLKQLQQLLTPQTSQDFVDLLNEGLSKHEALAVTTLNGGSITYGVLATGAYSGPTQFSAKRFFLSKPNDLTGGVFRDRIDYNRTDMHKPFWGDKDFINWQKEAIATGLPGYTGKTATGAERTKIIKDFALLAPSVFKKALDNEPDPTNPMFVWKTTSGKTNGHVIEVKAKA